jgi:hypothetical protein
MLTLHQRFSCDIWQRCCFDPATLTVASLATTAAGGVAQLIGGQTAASATLAGGNAALQAGQMQQQAANYQAAQLTQNAGQAFASGQRQMLDDQEKTRLAISTARADAGASGVNAGVGSPVSIVGSLARRGSYNAAMDMFNGESTATGLLNQAAGATYSGEAALIGGEEGQSASEISANATLAGTAGSLIGDVGSGLKIYGNAYNPSIKSS